MRKLLSLIALLLVLPVMSLAADTEPTGIPTWDVLGDYCAIYHVTADDSGALINADTTLGCPVFPHGFDYPMPDVIVLYGSFLEIGANTSGDSTIINLDVSMTNAAKASSAWFPISFTAGDAVYANRTGVADTIDTAAGSTASQYFSYALTSTQMAELLPYFRIRWSNAGGNVADSVDVDWYVIYLWDNLNED